jgi:DNA-binding response OmpR family regulator
MNKILVLDDDKALASLIKTYLEKNDKEVMVINDPKNVFNRIDSFGPDIIVIDLMMPNIDGLSVLKRIKNDEKYKDIPVLVMSAKNYKSTILSCLTAGAFDFLPKPFQLDTLLHKVNSY